MTTEKKTEFQLATADSEYILTASSKEECEEWLKGTRHDYTGLL